MSRYIDAEPLINELIPIVKSASLRNRNVYAVAKRCLNTVELAKTEDVAPVVHAHWVKKEIPVGTMWGMIGFVCSRCLYRFADKYNYCPECGAKMDLGEDEFIAPSIIAEGEDDHAD